MKFRRQGITKKERIKHLEHDESLKWSFFIYRPGLPCIQLVKASCQNVFNGFKENRPRGCKWSVVWLGRHSSMTSLSVAKSRTFTSEQYDLWPSNLSRTLHDSFLGMKWLLSQSISTTVVRSAEVSFIVTRKPDGISSYNFFFFFFPLTMQ